MQAVATRERDAPAGVLYCYVSNPKSNFTLVCSPREGGRPLAGPRPGGTFQVGEPSAVFLLTRLRARYWTIW